MVVLRVGVVQDTKETGATVSFLEFSTKILRNVVSESSFFQNDENHDIENVFCYRFFSPIEIDKCSPSPCQHGGVCSEVIGGLGYACRCAYGYKGQDCERKEMNEHIVARK